MNIAHLKDRALLESFGLQDTMSNDDTSDSEDDDDSELFEQRKEHTGVEDDMEYTRDDMSQQDEQPDITEEVKSEDLLHVLKLTKFNWSALEEAISQKFPLLPKERIG